MPVTETFAIPVILTSPTEVFIVCSVTTTEKLPSADTEKVPSVD